MSSDASAKRCHLLAFAQNFLIEAICLFSDCNVIFTNFRTPIERVSVPDTRI
ncbi:hypothetical protein [Coleofasciculus sp. FACHB-1120]|uniref:hypothetical protein n=1 Tax=Coleofasciculus sp. FACHB-1120 TaxID=2692783 RepID=UPI001A7EF008|nr:hypothetical protein [Coleofasciculus sp. FACHB-1120]